MRVINPGELGEFSRQELWAALHRVRLALFQLTTEPHGLLQLVTRLNSQPCEGNTPRSDPSIAHSIAPTHKFVNTQQ